MKKDSLTCIYNPIYISFLNSCAQDVQYTSTLLPAYIPNNYPPLIIMFDARPPSSTLIPLNSDQTLVSPPSRARADNAANHDSVGGEVRGLAAGKGQTARALAVGGPVRRAGDAGDVDLGGGRQVQRRDLGQGVRVGVDGADGHPDGGVGQAAAGAAVRRLDDDGGCWGRLNRGGQSHAGEGGSRGEDGSGTHFGVCELLFL